MKYRPRMFRVSNDGETGGAPPTPPAQPAYGDAPAGANPELQSRIDALFGRTKEQGEEIGRLKNENEALKAQAIAAQERGVIHNKLTQPPAPAPGGSTSPSGGATPPSVDSAIATLTQQVGEIFGALQAEKAAREQGAAFVKAREIVPGLTVDQDLRNAAGAILARDPILAKHPMGPVLAAALAAQLKAVGPSGPTDAQRAGTMTPTPSGASVVPAPEAKKLADMKVKAEELRQKCRGSGGSDHYGEYKNLMFEIGVLERKLKG